MVQPQFWSLKFNISTTQELVLDDNDSNMVQSSSTEDLNYKHSCVIISASPGLLKSSQFILEAKWMFVQNLENFHQCVPLILCPQEWDTQAENLPLAPFIAAMEA